MRGGRKMLACLMVVSLTGCAVATPYVPQGGHATVSRGEPIAPIDFFGNIFGLFSKVLLLNWKVDNHAISQETEAHLNRYVDSPNSMTEGTHFSLNEYAPGRALHRLMTNRKVAWPYRLLIGLPLTLLSDVVIPGRLFAGFLNPGDSYNPYTDTVSLYSDLPSIVLHEAGHAHDTNQRRYKGTYATIRLLPLVDLYQEFQATDEAIRYLTETGDRKEELASYKILYPAYGSYLGSYFFPPIGTLGGVVIGHVVGRAKVLERRGFYTRLDETTQTPSTPSSKIEKTRP